MAAERSDVRIVVDGAGNPSLADKELFQGDLEGLLDHLGRRFIARGGAACEADQRPGEQDTHSGCPRPT